MIYFFQKIGGYFCLNLLCFCVKCLFFSQIKPCVNVSDQSYKKRGERGKKIIERGIKKERGGVKRDREIERRLNKVSLKNRLQKIDRAWKWSIKESLFNSVKNKREEEKKKKRFKTVIKVTNKMDGKCQFHCLLSIFNVS